MPIRPAVVEIFQLEQSALSSLEPSNVKPAWIKICTVSALTLCTAKSIKAWYSSGLWHHSASHVLYNIPAITALSPMIRSR